MNPKVIERYVKEDGRTHGIYFLDQDTDQTFSLEARYDLGGMNFFSGNTEPRGHYLGLTPMRRAGGIVSFTAWSGIKFFKEHRNRFNGKKLKEFADRELRFDNPSVIELYERVVEKNKLHQVERVVI